MSANDISKRPKKGASKLGESKAAISTPDSFLKEVEVAYGMLRIEANQAGFHSLTNRDEYFFYRGWMAALQNELKRLEDNHEELRGTGRGK